MHWQILVWCKIIGAVQHDQLWLCISSSVIPFLWSTAAWLQHGFPVPEERQKAAMPPCCVLSGMLAVSSSYRDDVTIYSLAKHWACVVSTASSNCHGRADGKPSKYSEIKNIYRSKYTLHTWYWPVLYCVGRLLQQKLSPVILDEQFMSKCLCHQRELTCVAFPQLSQTIGDTLFCQKLAKIE